MAQKVNVQLLDDLDGSAADSTVEFGLDGVNYTIDLSTENAEQLRATMETFVEHAHRVGGRKRARHTNGKAPRRAPAAEAPSGADREQKQAMRKWAREKGWKIGDRGRIPADIVEAYEQAHRRTPSR